MPTLAVVGQGSGGVAFGYPFVRSFNRRFDAIQEANLAGQAGVRQAGQALLERGPSRDLGAFGPPGGGPTNFPAGPGGSLPAPPPTAAVSAVQRAAPPARIGGPPPAVTSAPRTTNTTSPLGGRARGPLLGGTRGGGFR